MNNLKNQLSDEQLQKALQLEEQLIKQEKCKQKRQASEPQRKLYNLLHGIGETKKRSNNPHVSKKTVTEGSYVGPVKKDHSLEVKKAVRNIKTAYNSKIGFRKIGACRRLGLYNTADELLEKLKEVKPANTHTRKLHLLQQEISKLDTVFIGSIKVEGYNDVDYKFQIQAPQESSLINACERRKAIISSGDMAYNDKDVIFKLLSVQVTSSVRNNKRKFNAVMSCIEKGIFVCYNKISGKCSVVSGTNNTRKNTISVLLQDKNNVIFKYQFLGVTPSGLKSCTVMTALTAYKEAGKDVVDCDDRYEFLDKASDGMFNKNFYKKDADGNIVFNRVNKQKAFKSMSRELLSSPACKSLFEARKYIIFSNLAEVAEKLNLDTCKDGTSFISARRIQTALEKKGHIFDLCTILGTVYQLRGGSAKMSGVAKSQQDLSVYAYRILKDAAKKVTNKQHVTEADFEAGVKYLATEKDGMVIVLDGIRYEGEAISFDIFKKCVEKIDFLGDWNGFKERYFNPVFNLTVLKTGHNDSITGLNTVVNLMMMHTNADKTKAFIIRKVKEEIVRSYSELGFRIEIDNDGIITNVSFDPSLIQRINNDSQMNQSLLKTASRTISAAIPQIVRGLMSNNMQRIANLIKCLNPDIKAHYLVVQADDAPLFGHKILAPDEFFCNDLSNDVLEVIETRHPISTKNSFIPAKRVFLDEIIERINSFDDLTDSEKQTLLNSYTQEKCYIIVGASKDSMEILDGYDFDIDALCVLEDPEVVEIFKDRLSQRLAPQIRREDDGMETYRFNVKELAISSFHDNPFYNGNLLSEEDEDDIAEVAIDSCESDFDMSNIINNDIFTKDQDLMDLSLETFLKLTKDFHLNPVAPVGLIATGFYNNLLILISLLDAEISPELKEKITFIFNSTYKTAGEGGISYESPFEVKNSNIYLSKKACIESIMNFKNSKGTLEDTIAFINDATDANRYPEESSIDAAKNDYKTADFYNHGSILKALGSDKNCSVSVIEDAEEVEDLYNKIISSLNNALKSDLNANNLFAVNLIKLDPTMNGRYSASQIKNINKLDKETILSIIEKEGLDIANDPKESKNKTQFVFEDSYYKIKKYLADFANTINVLASKKIEEHIFSDNSIKIRESICQNADKIAVEHKINREDKTAIRSIKFLGRAFDVVTADSDTVDNMNSIIYKKEVVNDILRNTAAVEFAGLTAAEIGCLVMADLIEDLNTSIEKQGLISSANKNYFNVFGEQILAYLKTLGIDVRAGERIISITKDGKSVSDKEIEGQALMFKDGYAVSDGYEIASENKYSNVSGIVEIHNGHAYVMFDREFKNQNITSGIAVQIKASEKTIAESPFLLQDKFTDLSIFADTLHYSQSIALKTLNYTNGKFDIAKEFKNALYTEDKGHKCALLSLYASKNISDILEAVDGDEDLQYKYYSKEASVIDSSSAHYLVITSSNITEAVLDGLIAQHPEEEAEEKEEVKEETVLTTSEQIESFFTALSDSQMNKDDNTATEESLTDSDLALDPIDDEFEQDNEEIGELSFDD